MEFKVKGNKKSFDGEKRWTVFYDGDNVLVMTENYCKIQKNNPECCQFCCFIHYHRKINYEFLLNLLIVLTLTFDFSFSFLLNVKLNKLITDKKRNKI